ncbi:MAG: alpha-mannosidase [Eubacteriales bacterium]|nr:alpha-mannosidase [Eubacteriales bacterium]
MILVKERVGKLISDIKGLIYTDVTPIKHYRFLKSKEKFENIAGICTDSWEILSPVQLWGGHREYFWFETFVTIPPEFEGKCTVFELKTGREGQWDATNPQFTIFVNNERRQGMDVNHREVVLSECAKAGERYRIVLSAFTGDDNFRLIMDSVIKVLHRPTENYFYDLSVPYEVARLLSPSDRSFRTILQALNNSLNLLDLRQEHSQAYDATLKQAHQYLRQEFYEKHTGECREKVYCVGHTHIDVAWMWTLAVTEDKAVRSFSTVLELMRQYPEYVFMSSQPQLYKYVKKNDPQLYEQIRERVKEGRWEVEGGMFVEADCNLSSGESLVRQFLYGKRFFKEEFGKDNEILWLPDVFGYSAALPQIMKKCGIRYFMTTKISWNEFNKMPYDTFEWEGIDGSRILTHFSPSRDYNKSAVENGTETEHFTTYNAYLSPSQVKGGWERYSQKYLNDEVLMSFGYGDGGGGPVRDMLENHRRLSKGIPGCPQTVMSTSAEFFHTLEKNVKDRKQLPVWVGELYLEYHRGTYTSMARNKKYNRTAEFLLQNIELFSSIGRDLIQLIYPDKELEKLWEIALRNQFHDILPGSSIKEVYDDSKAEYEQLLTKGYALENEALKAITSEIDAPMNALVVYNPNGMTGEDMVVFECPERIHTPLVSDGVKICPLQRLTDGRYLFTASEIPAKGYKTYLLTDKEHSSPEAELSVSAYNLENAFVRVELSDSGQIRSIYDKKEHRQLLKSGENGNVLMTYEDRPHNWDAWDINNYYIEKSWEITDVQEITVIETGPVRASIRIRRRYLDSMIVQDISLSADSPEIRIQNEIDWKEKNILLKALFPVDIHTDEASYEIQYGNVTRKTHYNTSWDFARFETCMHKWLDVSEDGYGVSVLNDCKYGANVHDGLIGISLLKSSVYPNPDADREHHSFCFAIYPHAEGFREAGTIGRAYALNNPLQCVVKANSSGTLPREYSAVSINVPNVITEVVKMAEDGKGTVLRLYEAFNRRTDVTMCFGKPLKTVYICNMLEDEENEIPFMGAKVRYEMKPYEIVTFKVIYKEVPEIQPDNIPGLKSK